MQLLQNVGTVEAEFASLSLILDPGFAYAGAGTSSPWLGQSVATMGESVLVVSPTSTTPPSTANCVLSGLHSYLADVLTSLRPRRRPPDEEEEEGISEDDSNEKSSNKDAEGNKRGQVGNISSGFEKSSERKEQSDNHHNSLAPQHSERRRSARHRKMRLDARSQMLRDELRSLVGEDASSSSSAIRTWTPPSSPQLTLHYLVLRDDLTKLRCSSMLLHATSSAMTVAPRGVLAVMICVAFSGSILCGPSTEFVHSLPLRMRSVVNTVELLTRKEATYAASSSADCRRHTRTVLSALLLTDDEAARTDAMVEAEGLREGATGEHGLDAGTITLALSERVAPQISSAPLYSGPRTSSSIMSKKFNFSADRALRLKKKRAGDKGTTVPAAASAYSGTSSAGISRIASEQMQVLSIAETDMILKSFEGRRGAPLRDRIRPRATTYSGARNRKYTRSGDGGSSAYHGADLGSEFDFPGSISSGTFGPVSPQYTAEPSDDATTTSDHGGVCPITPNSTKAAIPVIMRNARDSLSAKKAKHKRATRFAASGIDGFFGTGNGGTWETKGKGDRIGGINFDNYHEDDEVSQGSSQQRGWNGQNGPDAAGNASSKDFGSFDPFAGFSSQIQEDDRHGDSSAHDSSKNEKESSSTSTTTTTASSSSESTDPLTLKRPSEHGSSSASLLHRPTRTSPTRQRSLGSTFEQNPSSSSRVPALSVNVALNEDLSCSYRGSKISSCSVEGVVQVQVKSDSPILVPFLLGVRDPKQHIQMLQENKEFVDNVSSEIDEDNEDSPDYNYIVTVPKVDSYYPIMRYKCSNGLRPVPIRVQTRVRIYGIFCRVALQISSNPANEDDLTDLNIIMAVPSTVKGETLTTSPSGGVWNASKRSVLWCVAELGDGEKFQLQAQFEMDKDARLEDGDTNTKKGKSLPSFPVLVRCQCMYAQLSAVKLDVGNLSDAFPANISMKLARRFRLSHREKS